MKVNSFTKLPCGGHITQSPKGDQVFRIVREFSSERPLVMILLHPPVKGHDDIEPAVAFAKASGFGRLIVLYLFPYRAADIKEIRKREVPWGEGPFNRRIQDCEIHYAINQDGRVMADWGPDGSYRDADRMFLSRDDGSPRSFSPYPEPVFPIEVLERKDAAA